MSISDLKTGQAVVAKLANSCWNAGRKVARMIADEGHLNVRSDRQFLKRVPKKHARKIRRRGGGGNSGDRRNLGVSHQQQGFISNFLHHCGIGLSRGFELDPCLAGSPAGLKAPAGRSFLLISITPLNCSTRPAEDSISVASLPTSTGICATECCTIVVGHVFRLLESVESPAFFRSFFSGMRFEFSGKTLGATSGSKMLRKIISGGQSGADRAGLDFAIENGLEHGGYVPRGRKAEDGRIADRYNLVELRTSSYPARTKRNIEESDGTVIFSLERCLNGGTKLTRDYANKLGKPVLHIYHGRKEQIFNLDSLRHEMQTLTDFLCSNKIEVLNVAGPRESKEPGVYEWTLYMLRCFRNRAVSGVGPTEATR